MPAYLLELTGEVGSHTFNAADVRKALKNASGSPVDIMIDSFGGYVNEGLSISGAFRDHGQVTVHLRGMIASAATIASMGANKISMAPEALYLVHKASLNFLDWASRNADELQSFIEQLQHTKENLDAMDRAIAETYARRCKKPVSELLDLMKGERWLSAQETLEWGFIDEIQAQSEDNDDNSDSSNAGPKASCLSITSAVAARMTALGLPLPPVAVVDTSPVAGSENVITRIVNAVVNPIVKAISSLKNSDEMTPESNTKNQTPNTTEPNTQTKTPDTNTEPQATIQTSQSQNQNSQTELAAAQARIAELEAQLAKTPGAVTNNVPAQPVAPKAQTPDSPFAQYLRTCKTAQDLYDRIP